ncbi:MAG: serine hydrolase [Bacteroidetes Order II. Incertae sedis bacterium]|nr:serine hydrolase [Bacteroidetes Order II. bacterium]
MNQKIRYWLVVLPVLLTLSATQPPKDWAEQTLTSLSLEDRVAQLLAVITFGEFNGEDSIERTQLKALIQDLKVGGVILTLAEPLAQAELTNWMQEMAKVPLLISMDMENGVAMRTKRTTAFPTAMALGATQDPILAYQMGQLVAKEARALGVHQNFAPVADVNNNPDNPIINVRSYGESPEAVSKMVRAYIDGMQENGLIATVKHFPGHGDTATDSHHGLPLLPFDLARLESTEFVPFRDAVKNGVKSVMVGHLAIPALEKEEHLPATLSKAITTDILRNQWGFTGLVVTDAMGMKGVTAQFGIGEAAVRALEAGADQILMSPDPFAAHRAILQAVATGRLSEGRINRSVLTLLRLKASLKLHERKTIALSEIHQHVSLGTHKALAGTIAEAAFTLLRNEGQSFPLQPRLARKMSLVHLNDDDDPKVGEGFQRALQSVGLRAIQTFLLDRRSNSLDYETVLSQASNADVFLVPAYIGFHGNPQEQQTVMKHKAFLEKLIALGKTVILISFGSPYLTHGLQAQPSVFAVAYGSDPASVQNAAEALAGRKAVQGKLPVTVPGLYPLWSGLTVSPLYPMNQTHQFDPARFAALDALLEGAIRNKAFPAAATAFGTDQALVRAKAYGYQTYDSDVAVSPDMPFDLASLTKVVGLTTAVMKLYEEGKLHLDDKVVKFIPEFAPNGKDQLTIRHLMTHTGGLKAFYAFYNMGIHSREGVLQHIFADKLYFTPGTKMEYSDLDMILMGLIVERISGKSLDAYLKQHFWIPLGMNRTGFRPTNGAGDDLAVVPTEKDTYFRKKLMQGEVHDECAWVLGGTSGHAGLFSTANDLAIFAHMMLNEGSYGGQQYLKPETIRLFTKVQQPGFSTRALGWDTKPRSGYTTAGTKWGPRSYGHTGFTGTSIWIDPDAKLFAILLTNRVYPTRENQKIREVRPKYADMVWEIIKNGKVNTTKPANRTW